MDTCQSSQTLMRAHSNDNQSSDSFIIVGVGASAGGLEAFSELVDGLPQDLRCAIVFVQHLPPDHESLLPGLLHDRRPDLAFELVNENTAVKAGHVYLAPSSRLLTVHNGVLRVGEIAGEHPPHIIDAFLESLADDCHQRAVGVILSGAGHDGTKGVAAIRAQGGCVIVQDPATARFPSMPQTAIDAGAADLVLTPAAIARSAAGIDEVCRAAEHIDDLTTPEHQQTFFGVLYRATGYRFEHYKQNVVERRVRRRMHLRGAPSVHDYMDMLRHDPGEARQLATDFMIGVTSFFRDPDAWETLKKRVVRELVRQQSDEPIRVWTPACSTGEESYSIAMMLA
ncbi:MAG: hypothetical protein GF331_20680, partial [Chitinivibrionales bacterium]|nr:hypothetical protein [Chitinivibrionales bacterium]